MSSSRAHAFLAISFLAGQTLAAGSKYTVWSSVVFSRTGERTPIAYGGMPTILTPLGANQSYTSGLAMRERYLGAYTDNGVGGAPIPGLNSDFIDSNQVYVGTPDYQYTVGSAQAFMQGLYPPTTKSTGTVQKAHSGPVVNVLADGSTINAPLGDYQYAMIQTYDGNSPESVYLNAQVNCPAFAIAAESSQTFNKEIYVLYEDSYSFYQKVGHELLEGVLDEGSWNFLNAWNIYDYCNYMNKHNNAANAWLALSTDGVNNLQLLRSYANAQQFRWYGNLDAVNNLTSAPYTASSGSISTVAGNFLSSQLLGQLQQAINYKSQYYKLNLLFGDFQPLMSLFALLYLPPWNEGFYGIVDFASMAAFELFSYTDGSGDAAFPEPEELMVRFLFQNGTEGDLQSYPLFGNGPDGIDMTWLGFQAAMYNLVPGSNGDWCTVCQATSLFCSYYNASLSETVNLLETHQPVTPVIAGVIGALVSLMVAGLIFGAVMLFGRFRFHRSYSTKHDLGGYKGSQKLASDKDLVLPKGAAAVTTEEVPGSPVRGGHERVGSWELKNNEAGLPNLGVVTERRPSYEDDEGEIGEAPWVKPTEPDERV